MLLKDLQWEPATRLNAYWDGRFPGGIVYRRTSYNGMLGTSGISKPGDYQLITHDEDGRNREVYGESPNFLDALTCQCLLYELTREKEDGTET